MRLDPNNRWRLPLLILGWILVILSPIVGALPGPGGMFLFIPGLVILLRNSLWARRRYVILKRRYPKLGSISDRAMRRPSAIRRHEVQKARNAQSD